MNCSHQKDSKDDASEREFGFVFCIVFLIIAFLPLLKGNPIKMWAFLVSSLVFTLALIAPVVLKYPSFLWMKLGMFLHQIINPLVLGVIYFGVVWPIGVMMKKKKSGSIRLTSDSNVSSYWIHRIPAGPSPKTMNQQF